MGLVRPAWHFARVAALVAATFSIVACGAEGGTGGEATTPTSSTSRPSTTAVADVAVTTAAPPEELVATTVAIDAAAALEQGLAGLAAGYHFTSTVSVNEVPVLVADGDRIGGSSRLTLASDAATVAYVVTPGGNYARPEGGDWEQLDVPPAASDPMDALLAPSGVVHVATGDGTIQLRVTVTATSLGIAAEGTVDVDVVVDGGAIASITYRTPVEDGAATVVTSIGPVTDPTPIAPPI